MCVLLHSLACLHLIGPSPALHLPPASASYSATTHKHVHFAERSVRINAKESEAVSPSASSAADPPPYSSPSLTPQDLLGQVDASPRTHRPSETVLSSFDAHASAVPLARTNTFKPAALTRQRVADMHV